MNNSFNKDKKLIRPINKSTVTNSQSIIITAAVFSLSLQRGSCYLLWLPASPHGAATCAGYCGPPSHMGLADGLLLLLARTRALGAQGGECDDRLPHEATKPVQLD